MCQFPQPLHLHLPKHVTHILEYIVKKVEQSSLEVIGHSVFLHVSANVGRAVQSNQ